jgi:hypothetical protein
MFQEKNKMVSKEKRIEKAKKDLESACQMFGWEEKDKFDKALHAKNFLNALMVLEHLDKAENTHNLDYAVDMLGKNELLKKQETDYDRSPIRKVYDSIDQYVQLIQNGKLKGLDGYKTEDYAKDVMVRLEHFIPTV